MTKQDAPSSYDFFVKRLRSLNLETKAILESYGEASAMEHAKDGLDALRRMLARMEEGHGDSKKGAEETDR